MGMSMQHRNLEFDVVEVPPHKWRWTIYPKKSLGLGKVEREVWGTRRDAVAQCKLEIDRKLERLQHAKRT
jgi:hypothetical protein